MVSRRDVFDLVEHVGKAHDFKSTVAYVAAWAGSPVATQAQKAAGNVEQLVGNVQQIADWHNQSWQVNARAQADLNSRMLFNPVGKAGLDYLTGRGLLPDTLKAWGVGYTLGYCGDVKTEVPSVAFTWRDGDNITAIQHRFIDKAQGQRYGFWIHPKRVGGYAGERILFRLPTRRSDTLVLVEGEVNCLSVWQSSSFDVASFGSQDISAVTLRAICDLAPQYDRVLVWADNGNNGKVIGDALQGKGIGDRVTVRQSPFGADANDLLQVGKLANFLSIVTQAAPVKPLPCQANSAHDGLLSIATSEDEPFERRRDARWVWRWLEGLTERTEAALIGATAAANRLGVQLA